MLIIIPPSALYSNLATPVSLAKSQLDTGRLTDLKNIKEILGGALNGRIYSSDQRPSVRVLIYIKLPGEDSNLKSQIQILVCYRLHYRAIFDSQTLSKLVLA